MTTGMLKHDPSAKLRKHGHGYVFTAGALIRDTWKKGHHKYRAELSAREGQRLKDTKEGPPVQVKHVRCGYKHSFGDVRYEQQQDAWIWWAFDTKFFLTKERLTPEDVMALAMEQENRKRLKLEKAHALMAMRQELDEKGKRQSIPQLVKVAVWQRDGGRCADCGGQQELEFDHVIPIVLGGSNTERNLQLLCAACNRRKGGTLG